jgi:putative acetyltransferase
MMDITIRPANLFDRPQLLALWERAVRTTHQFLSEQDIVTLRPSVAEELANEAYEWWVVELAAHKIVAFLAFASDTIEGLFVDPAHHGRGIGMALVAHAQSRSEGVLLVDVNRENRDALGFYRRLGFVEVDESPTDAAGRPFPILRLQRGHERGPKTRTGLGMQKPPGSQTSG